MSATVCPQFNGTCDDRGVLPEVVAHRGASADLAEHTLAAYELALAQQADGLECDVRLTKDGQLVCVHDRTVDRTSSGTGIVSTMTVAELDKLRWGGADEPGVLTLEKLLELVRPGVRLFIETKHPVRYGGLVEAKLVALLARHGLARPKSKEESPVVVMSFSSRAIRRIQRHAPELPTVMLVGSRVTPSAGDYVGPSIERLREDPEYVARAGRPAYCWTVDDPADVRLCQSLGVRFIATNKPAATLEVLRGTVPESEPSR
ncbi:glycerophosphoryl diester phosphodiesterase [Kibdelosporangium banguiense]|uniref:Glycerophosphoryl diester phosphodiesterase n=1 Tax=Kibdelosporangium banguiense TaxID=1365924 RepID=A0ABS4TBC1_9PSEU|nr:glycerophosphodiester phosphodiesterase family protein [Kibdelosporangium banguiense]MBP2321722.1 glycerophosphoryl diester phosphodiesterase [Kibdelosporangium banguiense]